MNLDYFVMLVDSAFRSILLYGEAYEELNRGTEYRF